MKFVHPEMLWGMIATAIPIIVHLFNFRRFKKVYFSNVEFLKEIKQETQSKRNLKHLLILASRMLAIAAIVLAFAQPFIPQAGSVEKPGNTAVSIYIDNSFSMQGAGKDGAMLDLAKNKALEIVESYAASDKFQLLTTDFEGRHQRMVSKEEMTTLIQEVELSPASRPLSEVVARQRDAIVTSGLEKRHAYLLTDLQASVTNLDAVTNDTTLRVTVVPELPEITGNVFIDSVWFDTPVRQVNQPEILHARVVNTGRDDIESMPLQLIINGAQKSVASANLPASANTTIDITYTNTEPGFKHCSLVLDDASITKDDAYYFSYDVAERIRVLEILGNMAATRAVEAVFKDDPFYEWNSMSEGAIDYGKFIGTDFIVVNQLRSLSTGLIDELSKWMQAGGSALVIPASEIMLNEYNAALSTWQAGQLSGKSTTPSPVASVNYEHYIFKEAFQQSSGNIDLPVANSYYNLTISSTAGSEPMLTLQNGSPFLTSASMGNGRLYISCVSLSPEETNFTQHAFFPATLVRMAEYSQPNAQLSYFLGDERAIVLRNVQLEGDDTFRLTGVSNGLEVIPEHRNAGNQIEVFVHSDLQEAGNYVLNRGNVAIRPLSFNYNRKESYNETLSVDAFEEQLQTKQFNNWSVLEGDTEAVAAGATLLEDGQKYWLSLIVWALIFLAIEILLIKFWR
jgi:Aerotolerance regulator N-terminal